MSRLSCVQNCLCPDYRAFKIAYVQTIVRSKLHMSRLSCVQNCICPDYRAFIFFPDRVILNARRHLVRSFRSGHIDFRSETSTWDTLKNYLVLLDRNMKNVYVLSRNMKKNMKTSINNSLFVKLKLPWMVLRERVSENGLVVRVSLGFCFCSLQKLQILYVCDLIYT